MVASPIFSVLLEWLALATGGDAKAAEAPVFDFKLPDALPDNLTLGQDYPIFRACCAMGKLGSPLDLAEIWKKPHEFRPKRSAGLLPGGGSTGYVYTRHGGFIDFGHARDFIDFTRYFTNWYRAVATNKIYKGDYFVSNEGTAGDIYLVAEPATGPLDVATTLLIGARLAFDFSVWHEIFTYFNLEKFSAFAPEDLFSNALGVVAGIRAILNQEGGWDVAADRALKEVLEELGPMPKETTATALDYVDGRWFSTFTSTMRRNFLPPGAIKPWLVTDLAISGKEAKAAELARAIGGKPPAASISFPTHYNGIFLDSRARLVIRNPMQDVKDLVPEMSEIRGIDLLTVSERLRAKARKDERATIDQP
jgi:hypothetical protein